MASSTLRSVVHGLLAAGACIVAGGALADSPVANEVHSWNIPAEDGAAAVRDFGIQSGVSISAVQADLEGKRLNAVSGSMSVDDALRKLVAGTGLKYVYDASGRAVTLSAAAPASATKPTTATGPRSDPPPSAEPPPAQVELVEEIVVTARKRLENLQEVPISAEVVGSQTMAQYDLNSLNELAHTLPSIQINGTGAGGQFFVRGVGSGTSQTFDQSVGTFIDDIYHGRTRIAHAAFLDLDRVELLKGPQSIFFGNNAVAGALNIVTARPTDTFGGNVRALYGQYGQYTGEGALNIPVNEGFALRIAAIGDGLSGWQKNPFVGHDQPDRNNKGGRVSFLWRPSDDFDATLKIEGSSNHDSNGSQIADCPPPAPFVAAGFCKSAIAAGYPVGPNTHENSTNAGQEVDMSTFEDVLTMHYHIGSHTLTSVTGFYNYHFAQNVDADGTPLTQLNLQTKEGYHQVSQELRLASPLGQTLEYLVGLYVQNDRLSGHGGDLTYYFETPVIKANPTYAALVPYLPLAIASATGAYTQDEHSYAAFASFGWNVTDQLKLGAGIRGSWVYKTASGNNYYGTGTDTYGAVVPLPNNLQPLAAKLLGAQKVPWTENRSDNAAMPSAEIDYKVVPSALLYATYSRGFLAGIPTDVGAVYQGLVVPPILPEHVNAYEIGFKSNLFEDHLRFNLDAFRSNYTNLQVASAVVNTAGVAIGTITNAGSSRSQGVELAAELVAGGFRFRTAATYLNARYIHYPNVTLTAVQTFCRAAANAKSAACLQEFPAGVGPVQDLSGQPTGFAPTWSGSTGVSYSIALPRGYHFITEADAYASTRYFYGNNGTDDPEQMQPGYARVDGRLSLEGTDARWAIDVVVKNATDRQISLGGTGGTSLPTATGSTLVQFQQPRSFALQGRYQW
jgi:outer membrane receptor protein involved in Fe transport